MPSSLLRDRPLSGMYNVGYRRARMRGSYACVERGGTCPDAPLSTGPQAGALCLMSESELNPTRPLKTGQKLVIGFTEYIDLPDWTSWAYAPKPIRGPEAARCTSKISLLWPTALCSFSRHHGSAPEAQARGSVSSGNEVGPGPLEYGPLRGAVLRPDGDSA